MQIPVLLDANVVTTCRRRVHLENDPHMVDAPKALPDPASEQRRTDAMAHRRKVADQLAATFGADWIEISTGPTREREQATLKAMYAQTPLIGNAQLPRDREHGRRGRIDVLIHTENGYVPILVVRHKTNDPGAGAHTSPLTNLKPKLEEADPDRKVRPQPRDQLRLAHAWQLLRACEQTAVTPAIGGVIGLDAEVVLWHDLEAPTWPGGRSALTEYEARFADRLAIANAAATGGEPLAHPSRILDCRSCPWWTVCEPELRDARDVSLVLRGEDAITLRDEGIRTVDQLAALEPAANQLTLVGTDLDDAVILAKAWLADLTVVRRVREIEIPRADVEVDVDMESFGDSGAYLWGCLLSGVDIGEPPGYRAFVTWEPLPTHDEGRSFVEFWQWLSGIRARAHHYGYTFRAYCYNELAENRWLRASITRFPDQPGIPERDEIENFIASEEWVDLFRIVSEQFLCARGKGLKVIAPVAGFNWRDPEASGENSMRWYREAVGLDDATLDLSQRRRLLEYNEDDVRATHALRQWMSSSAMMEVPYAKDI